MATKTSAKPAIKTTAGEMLAALDIVSRAVPARAAKPILANVRVGDGVMIGTDLEVQITATLPFLCEPVLMPAARLQAILRSVARDADVAIALHGTSVTIKAGGGKWDLPTESVAEFPTWEPADLKPVCRLPADQFCRACRSTIYATDNESSRFALGAVLVEVKDGAVTFVGTDGRRLSAVEAETDQAVDDSLTLIPARAMRLMQMVAGGGHEDGVQLEATASEVVCTAGSFTVMARMTEGRFPRWRDVFPANVDELEPHTLLVADLLAATNAAAICTSEQSLGVKYDFGATLRLSAQSAEAGQAAVSCDVISPGKPVATKLNPQFVRDVLVHLDSDDEPHVEVKLADAQSAVTLRCGDVRAVIMPLAEDA